MIEINGLSYSVGDNHILNNITTTFKAGEMTALIGINGSGKSTLARHLNALYLPTMGTVTVDNMDIKDRKFLKDIRRTVAMVFQNPDVQAVANTVEDDVAFAPENMGLSPAETNERINYALSTTGTEHLRKREISTLSGGEKQLVAIAGALAMKPQYIIFDEATSMLDPASRKRVFAVAKELAQKGLGVIWITQNMEEAFGADTITIMHKGTIAMCDTPHNIFFNNDISKYGLESPESIKLRKALARASIDIDALLKEDL